MFRHFLVCLVTTATLAFAVAEAAACPSGYHKCGSFCCGD